MDFAEFYALMPPDNPALVFPGDVVQFPRDGPSSGSGVILRFGSSTFAFVLNAAGTYRVSFKVAVDEAGQLELVLNGLPLGYTVVGRATGTTQIVGEALVQTTVPSVFGVVNPVGDPALTITPNAGGLDPVSASLVIERIQ
ncbi:MAG: hypothetical protein DLM63_04815 [Solirubrobacterales bacterium]|nr:MAG: hypothetical protein DLM63_04815 [Solirubrobacterales bacterium]